MDLLAQMTTFTRVVESRSLSAAARDQRLSLAAVSRQLRALEDDLGVTLIARTTRSVNVTEAGRRFYEQAVRILAQVDDARSNIKSSRRAIEGRLTVSAGVSFGLRFVTAAVSKLMTAHPRLTVDLRLEDRLVDLVADGVDVAIRGGVMPPDTTSIVAHPIFEFERIFVASPAYIKKHKTPPRDPSELARHCCLVQSTGSGGLLDEWRFQHRTRKDEPRSVRVKQRLECNAPLGLREGALLGVGIVMIADWLVADDLKKRRLVRVLEEWTPPSSTQFWALHRSDMRGSPRVRAFIETLRAELAHARSVGR